MSHSRWMCSVLLLALLLVGTVPPALAQDSAPVMRPHGPRADAPPYGMRGPFAVGVRDFVIESEEEGGRPIPITVWYPAANPEQDTEDETYVTDYDDPYVPNFAIAGRALRDAEPDASSGPYPLVIYSHGYWLFRQASVYLMEQLASWGFVVMAGDHTDNWGTMFGESQVEDYVIRPQEISREIDFAETLTSADEALAGMIDLDNVGVTGQSMGADTTLMMGGARLNTDVFIDEWCALHPGDLDDPLNDCVAIPERLELMADMAGLDEVPEGLWPDWSDPRVDAIAPLAPGSQYFGQDGLASIDVPIIYFESELDWAQGLASEYYKPYEALPVDLRAHVMFERGDHGLYHNDCAAMPAWVDYGFESWCWDPVWSTDRAHDLIDHFVTAFMLAELKGDAEAAAALAPASVDFRGVEYQAGMAQATLDSDMTTQIDTYVEEMMESIGLPGFALGIVKDGGLAYAKGFGVADVETGAPVTPQTVFQLAEVTMAPTTLAMLQLADAGLIDLDAPITDYLPYFEMAGEGWEEITVHQLLLQTSGVPDSGDTAADWTELTPALDDEAVERLVRGLADTELLYLPGEGFEWSDIGFHILGDVVAKVTGQPYEVYMQENVLTPLGMAHSTFLRSEVDPALLASPHVQDSAGEAIVTDAIPYSRQFAAANNLHANVEDMARFAQANLNRGELDGFTLVASPHYDEMWTVQNETNLGEFQMGTFYPTALFANQGMGWSVTEIMDHPVVHAYGGERGYQSVLMLAPKDNLGVIVMGNRAAGEDFYTLESATDIMGMLLDAGE